MTSNNPIEKRNRMLKKIKADRERSQEIKQQDIFYITKYANKFKIDTKNLLQWFIQALRSVHLWNVEKIQHSIPWA